MTRIAVTGGSGFLGQNVVLELLNQGNHVVCIDVKHCGLEHPNLTVVSEDVLNQAGLASCLANVSKVIHLAGFADLEDSRREPYRTAEVNILGTINLLNASLSAGVSHFVYGSTVYAGGKKGGFYRCSKQAAEAYVSQFDYEYGLPCTILRYGSLYGRNCPPNNGIVKILSRALATGEVVYEGDPDSIRSYIHVSDAARATIALADPSYASETIVITGQQSIKISDLLSLISELLDLPADSIRLEERVAYGHYRSTPYNFNSDALGKKYTLPYHIELDQGLLDLAEHLNNDD